MATIYHVARRSGVSTATVSRVMKGGTGFSAATRERVLAAAGELAWVPSGSARGLASRRTGIVGLIFPDLDNTDEPGQDSPLYFDQIIRGAERAATAMGDAVLIAGSRCATGRELVFSVASKVDGLVVLAGSLSKRDLEQVRRSVPVVLLADRASHRGTDGVAADNRGGTRAATSHLIGAHKYRDLVFVGGVERAPDSIERFAGFCDALQEAGLPIPDAPAALGEFTESGGELAMRQLLGAPRIPRAVVFANDQMAIGALSALRRERIPVPTQMAIVGFDDIAAARHVRPALTTVRQPMRDLGEQAVRLLFERVAEPDGARRAIVLATELILRRSCGCGARARAGATS